MPLWPRGKAQHLYFQLDCNAEIMSSNLIGGISFLYLFFLRFLFAKPSPPEESWPRRKAKRINKQTKRGSLFLTYQRHDYSVFRYCTCISRRSSTRCKTGCVAPFAERKIKRAGKRREEKREDLTSRTTQGERQMDSLFLPASSALPLAHPPLHSVIHSP